MSYYFATEMQTDFETAVQATKQALQQHGFGVLTEIDVADTLRKKIGVDFRPYRILGACNPAMAHKALSAEDKIGLMLPCNVIVQQHDDGKVEVAVVDPVASMQAVNNPALGGTAGEVRESLRRVIDDISA